MKEISKETGKELYKKGQFSQDGQEFLAANNFTDPYECCWYATKKSRNLDQELFKNNIFKVNKSEMKNETPPQKGHFTHRNTQTPTDTH